MVAPGRVTFGPGGAQQGGLPRATAAPRSPFSRNSRRRSRHAREAPGTAGLYPCQGVAGGTGTRVNCLTGPAGPCRRRARHRSCCRRSGLDPAQHTDGATFPVVGDAGGGDTRHAVLRSRSRRWVMYWGTGAVFRSVQGVVRPQVCGSLGSGSVWWSISGRIGRGDAPAPRIVQHQRCGRGWAGRGRPSAERGEEKQCGRARCSLMARSFSAHTRLAASQILVAKILARAAARVTRNPRARRFGLRPHTPAVMAVQPALIRRIDGQIGVSWRPARTASRVKARLRL